MSDPKNTRLWMWRDEWGLYWPQLWDHTEAGCKALASRKQISKWETKGRPVLVEIVEVKEEKE